MTRHYNMTGAQRMATIVQLTDLLLEGLDDSDQRPIAQKIKDLCLDYLNGRDPRLNNQGF